MEASRQDLQWAATEASRCLYCFDAPCIKGCPAHVDIPQFVRLIRWNDIKGAKEVIRSANCLGGICGYLCPSEDLCERECVHSKIDFPIKIAALQKIACDHTDYVSEMDFKQGERKVAIIGGGPAGISCALQLKALGYEAEIFEKEKFLAGTVTREIPAFKVPQRVIDKELRELNLKKVKVHLAAEVDRDYLRKEIAEKYDAVFFAMGLNKTRQFALSKKVLRNVDEASPFLKSVKTKMIREMKGVCVTIGGGDTALDCARTAVRLGAERSIVAYRRSKNQMPAAEAEFLKAVREGVEFLWRVSPVSLRGKGKVTGIEMVRTELTAPKLGGRKGFKAIAGTEFHFPANHVIFALGKERDDEPVSFLNRGDLRVNPNTLRMGKSKFFAGGDYVNAGRTVVEAVADGKKAALSIEKYLKSL